MKTARAISRELSRVKAILRRAKDGSQARGEMYGAMQALEWVRENDAAAPSTIVVEVDLLAEDQHK